MKINQTKIKNIIKNHCEKNGLSSDEKGYVNSSEENLIETFNNWKEIKIEFGKGQGSELKQDKNGIIKFNALHSSSALCVNNFAYLKNNKKSIELFGNSDFNIAEFEKKLNTGISRPNLDFYLENKNSIIGFESKFIEFLIRKKSNKNLEKYISKLNYLPQNFIELIKYYINNDEKYYLDIAQLLKHTIGLINNKRNKKIKLVYIYWLPTNWEKFENYQKHQNEIKKFASKITNIIDFQAISYLNFWKKTLQKICNEKIVNQIKKRYLMEI